MRTQARLIIEGFALLILFSTVPAAGDGRPDPYGYGAEPPSVDYDWSGIYIGGQLGAATAHWDWNFISPAGSEQLTQRDTAAALGAQIGAQKQWNSLVLGAEVTYTFADLGETSGSSLVAASTRSATLNNLLTASGRVGTTWQNILAYLKGGYASADVGFNSGGAGGVTGSSSREQGWVAGMGVEYGIRPDINIGVEYDYIHINAPLREQTPTASDSQSNGGMDVQALMARLNFKFGTRPEPVPIK